MEAFITAYVWLSSFYVTSQLLDRLLTPLLESWSIWLVAKVQIWLYELEQQQTEKLRQSLINYYIEIQNKRD